MYQGLPGVKIAYTPAIAFNERLCTGGVAVLFPPGWHVLEEIELVKGRSVAALVQDRTCRFYVISVYIHPDNRSGDMEALLRAWRFLEKKSDYAFVAGDFNGIDKHHPQLWERFPLQFQCSVARCCLGQVPGGAPFSQRSELATACTSRMQI